MAAIIKPSFIEAWGAGRAPTRSAEDEAASRKLRELYEFRRARTRVSNEDDETVPRRLLDDVE